MADFSGLPDSKQLRILKKLTAHLTAPEVTSGYPGFKTYRGLAVVPAKELTDCLSILEAPRPIVGEPAGEQGLKRKELWTLLVQGWPIDDALNPSDPAYAMKALVERQLSLIVVELPDGRQRTDDLYLLGKDIISMTIGQGVVRPPSEEGASRLAMFYLPLYLELTTNVVNPYALPKES